jgi:hypothetical protein
MTVNVQDTENDKPSRRKKRTAAAALLQTDKSEATTASPEKTVSFAVETESEPATASKPKRKYTKRSDIASGSRTVQDEQLADDEATAPKGGASSNREPEVAVKDGRAPRTVFTGADWTTQMVGMPNSVFIGSIYWRVCWLQDALVLANFVQEMQTAVTYTPHSLAKYENEIAGIITDGLREPALLGVPARVFGSLLRISQNATRARLNYLLQACSPGERIGLVLSEWHKELIGDEAGLVISSLAGSEGASSSSSSSGSSSKIPRELIEFLRTVLPANSHGPQQVPVIREFALMISLKVRLRDFESIVICSVENFGGRCLRLTVTRNLQSRARLVSICWVNSHCL